MFLFTDMQINVSYQSLQVLSKLADNMENLIIHERERVGRLITDLTFIIGCIKPN